MIYLQLFWSFLQIGLFSVGGGYAAMPLIQAQTGSASRLAHYERVYRPGHHCGNDPRPYCRQLGHLCGHPHCRAAGALVATLGCIFPSLFIVSLLAFIYYRYKNLSILQSVLASLRPAVVALIASAGLSILLQVVFGGAEMAIVNVNWVGLVLFAAAFAALRGLKWNPILVMVLCGVGNLLVGLVLQTIG